MKSHHQTLIFCSRSCLCYLVQTLDYWGHDIFHENIFHCSPNISLELQTASELLHIHLTVCQQ